MLTILTIFAKLEQDRFIDFLEMYPLPSDITIDDVLNLLDDTYVSAKKNNRYIAALLQQKKEELEEETKLREMAKAIEDEDELESERMKKKKELDGLER